MAFNVVEDALKHSEHGGTELLVLIVLAESANRDTRISYPAVATIAKLARVSRATVQRALRKLEASGEVEVIDNALGGRGTRRYRVVVGVKGHQSEAPPQGSPNGSPNGSGLAAVRPLPPRSREAPAASSGRPSPIGDLRRGGS